MPLQHHPLHLEFPEYSLQLQALLSRDGHFSRLVEEYDALDKRIYEVESGRVAIDEIVLLGLKMQRVSLKDELGDFLRKAL
ncbi:DUF465 domain-containing protein [Pseudomonas sp. TMP25]|uniref:YdcH family protein n=1 Tax=Pseudomonas sp. TMP25 TaxID=3136561 RepID=UPI003100E8F5